MKKIVKRACAGMFAALMAVSAMSVPSSATSVSGQVSRISCSGSNTISEKGAAASTRADTAINLVVQLYYDYNDFSKGTIEHWNPSNANNPVTYIDVYYNVSGNVRSERCMSSHTAVYTSPTGGSTSWKGSTKWQYY